MQMRSRELPGYSFATPLAPRNADLIHSTLVDESWRREQALAYSAAEAGTLARAEIARRLAPSPSVRIIQLDEKMAVSYEVEQDRSLTPVWRSTYLVEEGPYRRSYHARLDLVTGELLIVPLQLNFTTDIYKTTSPPPTISQVLLWEEVATG